MTGFWMSSFSLLYSLLSIAFKEVSSDNRLLTINCPEKTKIIPCGETTTRTALNMLDCTMECSQLPDFAGLKYIETNKTCECFRGAAGIDLKLSVEKDITFCWAKGALPPDLTGWAKYIPNSTTTHDEVKYYRFIKERLLYPGATCKCAEMGGMLGTVRNVEQKNFIENLKELIGDRVKYYFGLRKDEAAEPNVYRWLDGELPAWTNWNRDTHLADKDCASFGDYQSYNVTWVRLSCGMQRHVFCETPRI